MKKKAVTIKNIIEIIDYLDIYLRIQPLLWDMDMELSLAQEKFSCIDNIKKISVMREYIDDVDGHILNSREILFKIVDLSRKRNSNE